MFNPTLNPIFFYQFKNNTAQWLESTPSSALYPSSLCLTPASALNLNGCEYLCVVECHESVMRVGVKWPMFRVLRHILLVLVPPCDTSTVYIMPRYFYILLTVAIDSWSLALVSTVAPCLHAGPSVFNDRYHCPMTG